jgi:tetratricopeptide (TPR) repeat protein
MVEASTWQVHNTLYGRADDLFRKNQFKLALRAFKQALLLAPRDADTNWAIASCYSEMNSPFQAERYFRRARALAEWSQRGDLLYNIANAKFDQRQFQAAAKLYRLVPRSSTAYLKAQRNTSVVHRLLANPSVKGTSRAKAQAAPYLER